MDSRALSIRQGPRTWDEKAGSISAGPKGSDAFDPQAIEEQTDVAPVVITDFLLLNQSVPVGRDSLLRRISASQSRLR